MIPSRDLSSHIIFRCRRLIINYYSSNLRSFNVPIVFNAERPSVFHRKEENRALGYFQRYSQRHSRTPMYKRFTTKNAKKIRLPRVHTSFGRGVADAAIA